MTLEDFKASYKDKTPLEKLKLLLVQTDYIRDDVRSLERDRINGNEKGADYMRSEIRAKEDRIQWLYDQLAPVLKAQEPRVMSAADVAACPNGTVLWVEERQGVTWNMFPLEVETSSTHPDTGTDYLFFITYHDIRKFECSEYNQTWRCWTSRPTDAQREAAPWES